MGYRSVRSRFSFSYYNWICFCFFSPFLFCRVCFAWLPLSSSSLSGCTTRIHFRFTHTHGERAKTETDSEKEKKIPDFLPVWGRGWWWPIRNDDRSAAWDFATGCWSRRWRWWWDAGIRGLYRRTPEQFTTNSDMIPVFFFFRKFETNLENKMFLERDSLGILRDAVRILRRIR